MSDLPGALLPALWPNQVSCASPRGRGVWLRRQRLQDLILPGAFNGWRTPHRKPRWGFRVLATGTNMLFQPPPESVDPIPSPPSIRGAVSVIRA